MKIRLEIGTALLVKSEGMTWRARQIEIEEQRHEHREVERRERM